LAPLCGVLLLVALGAQTRAAEPEAVYGLWVGEESVVEISPAGESLSMAVIALADPHYLPEEEAGPSGAIRRDDNNPEPALQDRPVLGLELLSDYRFDGKRWSGRAGERLEIRGYIGVPMLGRTQQFEPLVGCNGRVLAMFEASAVALDQCD
jgi:GAF domain-containing protein